jgi:hypothetical protein
MFIIFDFWMDNWVRTMLFYKFLPGFIVEAQSNLCQPHAQASSENNQHTE